GRRAGEDEGRGRSGRRRRRRADRLRRAPAVERGQPGMIVRISGEDQYRLDDSDADRLNELENAVIAAVDGGDDDAFANAFPALLDYVRSRGTPVDEDELETSDLILPPADVTLEEASREFTGEGLIPD